MDENERIKEKIAGNPKNIPGILQSIMTYTIKRIHDICMLLDARMILEWALHSVNFNESRCTFGTHA